MLGIESASALAERRAAEGKAIGAACRNAARAIEDCYTLNKKADKAAIYAGWREMDDYMRENKLEPVPPQIKPESARAKSDDTGDDQVASAESKSSNKADNKADTKADTKADNKTDGKPTRASSKKQAAANH